MQKCDPANVLKLGSVFFFITTSVLSSFTLGINLHINEIALAQREEIILTSILDDLGDKERWPGIMEEALKELRSRHPELKIGIEYNQLPTNEFQRNEFIKAIDNKTPVDIMSVNQIWLGEFAEKGFLTDLTPFIKNWSHSPSDWYAVNWDGGSYNYKVYGIWLWTDVRGMYYWKDLLNQSGVEPASLSTWDGYIAAAKKLNSSLNDKGIQGMHLTGASHSPDLWYPYLWMLGGDILERRGGHPTQGAYWFPAYNGSEGVGALQFLKDQVDSGIVPQKNHSWGEEFVSREFAVMIEASHVPLYFQPEHLEDIKENVGFLALPIPSTAGGAFPTTMMAGWELAVPITSRHKDLAWEFVTLIAEPRIIAPWLAKYGYLPTQLAIGQGEFSNELRQHNPYYDEMISMIPTGQSVPNIPEYPQIAEDIREAIDEVYYSKKKPSEALQEAAIKSAKTLGW
jgi:multiple sugar transport system substrate-binding protein